MEHDRLFSSENRKTVSAKRMIYQPEINQRMEISGKKVVVEKETSRCRGCCFDTEDVLCPIMYTSDGAICSCVGVIFREDDDAE